MKILALTRYSRLGASSRMRTLQYLPYLMKRGFDVDVSSLFDDAYLINRYGGKSTYSNIISSFVERWTQLCVSSRYDLLWIEKEIFPFLPAATERFLNLIGIRYVVDYDDALFHRYDQHHSVLVRTLLGKKIDRVMANATTVIAGNSYLANRASKSGAGRVRVIPTALDIRRYQPVDRSALTDRKVIIGWIGSPTTARYIADIYPALLDVQRHYDARYVFVGSGPLDLPGLNYEIVTWTEAGEAEAVANFDIGIMPLPDNPWERGKCGYKLIQYMASGLPVVASPVGVNELIVEAGLTGFLATTLKEWQTALAKLVTTSELRRKMGIRARAKAETSYSTQRIATRLGDILEESIRN